MSSSLATSRISSMNNSFSSSSANFLMHCRTLGERLLCFREDEKKDEDSFGKSRVYYSVHYELFLSLPEALSTNKTMLAFIEYNNSPAIKEATVVEPGSRSVYVAVNGDMSAVLSIVEALNKKRRTGRFRARETMN